MTQLQTMVWFVANALAIVGILTVGTLGAADILTRRGRELHRSIRAVDARRGLHLADRALDDGCAHGDAALVKDEVEDAVTDPGDVRSDAVGSR